MTDESFPRMWDQHEIIVKTGCVVRIIPTYVGSTGKAISSLFSITNHSHVCGINAYPELSGTLSDESFPRMWDQRARLMN